MATTEITELNAATVFADGDLALIRKSGETKDRKITQQNLIKSMGNPAVKGFTASSDEANKVTLDPSNGTVIDSYYDGMEISFISPINSTGLVQVRIGALAYKDIFVLNSAASVELTTTTYIQAIYSNTDNKFYQTNAATTQVFTNEYNATGVVAGDNSTTTYILTSAYGIQKTEYYPRMSLSFNADIASKGGVLVNVDGLGNKILTDKVGDKIANDLVEGQEIFAIYNGTDFIKNLFSEEVPEAPEIPADAFDENTGEIIPENVPEVNKQDVTVGSAGNDYTTIMAAITDLVNNFGEDGGNRLCTIILSNTYVWNEKINLQSKNYSWITIKSTTEIAIGDEGSIILNESSIKLTGTYRKNSALTGSGFFINCIGARSIINIENLTFYTKYSFLNINAGIVNITNAIASMITGGTVGANFVKCMNNGTLNSKNCTLDLNTNFTIGNGGSALTAELSSINVDNLTVTMKSNNASKMCYFDRCSSVVIINSNINTTTSISNAIAFDICRNISVTNTSITSSTNKTMYISKSTGTFTNCTVLATASDYMLNAVDGSNITVSGGSYTKNGTTSQYNITASGQGTVVRLLNNPVGGTLADSGGVIA